MKHKYISPEIKISRFMGEKEFLEGGGFGTQSQGTDLFSLGAKKRNDSSFYDEVEDNSYTKDYYEKIW